MEAEILKRFKWRRLGVLFWSLVLLLLLVVVLQIPLILAVLLLLPSLLIRIHLLSGAILSFMGVRYASKVGLFVVDILAFVAIFVAKDYIRYVTLSETFDLVKLLSIRFPYRFDVL